MNKEFECMQGNQVEIAVCCQEDVLGHPLTSDDTYNRKPETHQDMPVSHTKRETGVFWITVIPSDGQFGYWSFWVTVILLFF